MIMFHHKEPDQLVVNCSPFCHRSPCYHA